MKNTIFKFSILLFVSLLIASCGKDDSSGDSNSGKGIITATVDGKSFTSLSDNTFASIVDAGSFKQLLLIGYDSKLILNGKHISISLTHLPSMPPTEGTNSQIDDDCSVPDAMCLGFSFTDLVNTKSYHTAVNPDTEMNVTIESIDYRSGGHIKGSFFGVALCEGNTLVDITNGSFFLDID